jgi:hypothetical protein
MNPELIELYRAVQKHRGEWQVFDPVIYGLPFSFGACGVVIGISHATGFLTVQYKIGAMSGIRPDDPDLLWLPPVYSDDGRCLDAILGEYSYEKWKEGTVYLYFVWIPGVSRSFKATTLPEALLRAIAAKGE